WIPAALNAIPLAIASGYIVAVTARSKWHYHMPPPGGSIFTAALTDVEIVARYLCNALIPTNLSMAYYVEPIVSLGDPRLWAYGGAIAAFVALTLWLAENRRRAVFGWLWVLGALGPSLNFVATDDWMQDRFFYLSLPGLFLAIGEAGYGLTSKFKTFKP